MSFPVVSLQCVPAALRVLPAHDVAQFFQVGRSKVPVVSIAALDVLFNAVQIQCVQVQKFLLKYIK